MSDRWSRKRALASKLQKAREAKLRRSEPRAEDHQSAREDSSELLAAEPTSQPDVSDDEMLPWDDDDNSLDECFAFSPHESKAVLHDWLSTQDSNTVRMQGIIVMDALMQGAGVQKMKAAEIAGTYLNVSERTVRKWLDEFYASEGEIHEEGRGTWERSNMVRDEGIRRKVVAWIRAECCKQNSSLDIHKLHHCG